MRRLTLLLACLAVFLSLGTGSVAHAMEPVACLETGTAIETGHVNGDGDQVPFDGDKDYPHHHGGCHGHHVATLTARADSIRADVAGAPIRQVAARALATSEADPALRPPQA